MPPRGANEGEVIDAREGEDSVWRKERRPIGVEATTSGISLEKDLSNAGVRMVRLAGRRRLPFGGIWTGDGGADR